MRLLLLWIASLTLFVACTSNEPMTDDVVETEDSMITHYLTVNLTGPSNVSTRAGFDSFEEGLKTENAISRIRFYFFDEHENSIMIKGAEGSFNNYLDWYGNGLESGYKPDGEKDLNIEKTITAHLKFQTYEEGKLPVSVVAILNASDQDLTDISNISDLNKVTGNFDILGESSYFAMSSSVYADPDSKVLYEAVDIQDNISQNENEAYWNPVILYVERINAKVRVRMGEELTAKPGNITLADGRVLFNTQVENNSTAKNGDEDNRVYVELLGWNLSCEPVKSYLIKNIDPAWTNSALFGTEDFDWTNVSRKRSFWAINPVLTYYVAGSSDYRFGNYADAQKIKGFGIDDNINYIYTQENAAEAKNKGTAHPTQVVIAARLVNSKGEPWEVVEWGTNYYKKEDLLTTLSDIANIFEVTVSITEEKDEEGNTETVTTTEYKKLDEIYFKFVSAKDAGKITDDGGRYYTYFQLDSEKVKDKKLAMAVNGEDMKLEDINIKLSDELAPAKIWTEGKTYYSFEIEHVRATDSEGNRISTFGVVRNHIYDAVLISFNSLGTPVFNENDVIIPERTKDDDSFIAAQINVLTWRLVSKNLQLEW